MLLNEISSEWSVWFDKKFSSAGQKKALGFVRAGQTSGGTLIDLEVDYVSREPAISYEEFVAAVAKSSNISKAVKKQILDVLKKDNFEGLLGKKF